MFLTLIFQQQKSASQRMKNLGSLLVIKVILLIPIENIFFPKLKLSIYPTQNKIFFSLRLGYIGKRLALQVYSTMGKDPAMLGPPNAVGIKKTLFCIFHWRRGR